MVNTVSELGIVATRKALAYVSSKGALMQFTKGAALELAPFGIRVNAVCPAGTESEMFRQDMSACEGGYEQNVRRLAASYPLGRIAVPMDIAPAVLFLASEHASFMTGAHILLDAPFKKTLMLSRGHADFDFFRSLFHRLSAEKKLAPL